MDCAAVVVLSTNLKLNTSQESCKSSDRNSSSSLVVYVSAAIQQLLHSKSVYVVFCPLTFVNHLGEGLTPVLLGRFVIQVGGCFRAQCRDETIGMYVPENIP